MTPSAHPARQAIAAAALVCGAALVAACGSVQSTSSGQTSSAGSGGHSPPVVSPVASDAASQASSAGPSSAAARSGCAASDLKVTIVTSGGGAAAGSTYYPLNFTNVSGSSCTLDGYPGISFVTSPAGSQIGGPASRNPAVTAAPVTLAPGGTAHATLQVVDALNYSASVCHPVTAHWLRVFPPNQYSAVYVSFTATTCSAKVPSNLGSALTVDAIKAGEGKPGQGL
jgi:Protein of unknown function (DUF4232)